MEKQETVTRLVPGGGHRKSRYQGKCGGDTERIHGWLKLGQEYVWKPRAAVQVRVVRQAWGMVCNGYALEDDMRSLGTWLGNRSSQKLSCRWLQVRWS